MKVDSFWRCTGSAGVYLSVESGKDEDPAGGLSLVRSVP